MMVFILLFRDLSQAKCCTTMKVSLLFLALMPAKGFVNNGGAKDHASALNLRSSQQYIPKGFTEESWTAFKAKEKREHAKKKHHFQSRPLVDFLKDLEAGKVR